MQAIDKPFREFMEGTKQFLIPVFQRDYSWSEEQCEQLWADLLHVGSREGERPTHFLGSVVYIGTGAPHATFNRWLLVDGQQRVTTLTLLLLALRDHLLETGWQGGEDDPTAAKIEDEYLANRNESGDRHFKLVLRRHDQETLHALQARRPISGMPSPRIQENYQYFRDKIAEVDPGLVYLGFCRLVIVHVALERGADDPQLIFESLNSTGLDLRPADLIRNYVLMRLPEDEQRRLYEEYWQRMELLFRGADAAFDNFLRDHLALRTQVSKQDKADVIYFAFRRHFEEAGIQDQLDAFLAGMLECAQCYADFALGGRSGRVGRALAQIRQRVDVPAILVGELLRLHDRGDDFDEDQFLTALGWIDSYLMRRSICGRQTRGYWTIFAGLAYRLDPADPLASLAVGFGLLGETARCPTDEEFRAALEGEVQYGKSTCRVLLSRLENHGTREPSPVDDYTIEHILPQNRKLNRAWREMLGPDWREIQRDWVDRLGNLTLTAYNSRYSDRSFQEKKSIAGGFSDSAVRLNQFVRQQERWTQDEIEERGTLLASRALEVWPMLAVDAELLQAAREKAKRDQASRRDVSKVPMKSSIRQLFEAFRVQVNELGPDVIEIAEPASVSYHGPDFFLEVIPRASRLTLLMPLEFHEIEDPADVANDAREWKFVTKARHDGGVLVPIRSEEDMPAALAIVTQALHARSEG